jgi:hypothetical protein
VDASIGLPKISAQFWKRLTRLRNRPVLHFDIADRHYPMWNGLMGQPDPRARWLDVRQSRVRFSLKRASGNYIAATSSMRTGRSAFLLREYRLISMI